MLERRFLLPGGVFTDDGTVAREARIRDLAGRDEEEIFALPAGLGQARLASEVLARTLVVGDGDRPLGRAGARGLLVGDAEFALLRLYEALFGEALELVVRCPSGGCGARMDLRLPARDVPFRAVEVRPSYEVAWRRGQVRFRLPRGDDLEDAAARADAAPAMAAALIQRCVLSVDGEAEPALGDEATATLAEVLGPEIERLSPCMDLDLEVVCPECGRASPVELDVGAIVLGRLLGDEAIFEAELHLLARHYHWPPSELYGLERGRRKRFVSRLVEALERDAAITAAGAS